MTNDELGRDQTDWNGQVKPPMERKGQISRRVNRALIDLKGSLPSATWILVMSAPLDPISTRDNNRRARGSRCR